MNQEIKIDFFAGKFYYLFTKIIDLNKLSKIIKLFYWVLIFGLKIFLPKKKLNNTLISFTSYKSRINQSFLTIFSLLGQSVGLNIIMFIAEEDRSKISLRLKILKMIFPNFHIIFCEDIKSYKKLVPLFDLSKIIEKESIDVIEILKKNIEYVVTVDDDVIYSPYLIENHIKFVKSDRILCNSAMVIEKDIKYKYWSINKKVGIRKDILPVGAGSILYPYKHLKKISGNFMEQAPTCDDIWFFSCLKNHCEYYFHDPDDFISISRFINQKESLYSNNSIDLNDIAVKKLL